MMSDMKTKPVAKSAKKTASSRAAKTAAGSQRDFTVRDLNRQPQVVLNAARASGGVHVRSRTGERFLVKPDPKPVETSDEEYRDSFTKRIEALHEQMRKTGQGFTAEGWETFSKMIAGE